ncbi:hypothetical protein MASR2M8_13760 [Opitutaceae bacterium]
MRSVWLFLLTLFSTAALLGSDVTLVRVWTGPRTAESFERISEYFSGKENTGGQTILRTQTASRAGYYWLIRTQTRAATDARIELSVLVPGSHTPRVITLPTRLPTGSHATMVGLTGDDWPQLEARPVAWKLRVLDAAGNVLATEESFLWDTTLSS